MQTSIIKYSETKSTGRLDAEFYHPKYLAIDHKLSKLNSVSLKTLVNSIHCGPFGSTILCDTYIPNGIFLLRPFNIFNYSIDNGDLAMISNNDIEKKGLKLFTTGDLMFARVGDIKCGIVPKSITKLTISPNIIALKTNLEKISSYYICVYFNSHYGTMQLLRLQKMVAQPTISTIDIGNLQIPIFSEKFQKSIEDMVLKAHEEREKANTLTKEAQILLEKELGIYNWTPPKQTLNISIKKYSETKSSNRIDAEYYQPKYDAILEKITSYKGGYKTLGEICSSNKDTFKIIKDQEYQYIEIGSINTGCGDITSSLLLGDDLPANCKRVLYKDDIVVSKVRPYRGAISIVNKNDYVGSGAFTVFQAKDIVNKETIYNYLRLPIMLELSLKPSTGTSYPTIVDEDIYNTIIPIIDKKTQDIIAEKITQAHRSRQESKRLLELAKSTVENAIEHGE